MKTAIIGTGNIGTAIAQGLLRGTLTEVEEVTCTVRSGESVERLRGLLPEGVRVTRDNGEAVVGSKLIIVAVKPGLVKGVIQEIRPWLTEEHLLVSVAAGVTIEELSGFMGEKGRVIPLYRLMPNTALSVSQSVTLLSVGGQSGLRRASLEGGEHLCRLFSELGGVYVIPESLMESGTLLTSAGIAFALRYIRAATEGGVALGFTPALAQELVMGTVFGAVSLLKAKGGHPEVEIDKVTSAGGVTIRGLNAMEAGGFTAAVQAGLRL
ncbi:MAG: pyrroline-5-carboxylate reductase [Tannerellaceae bacterium]|jgi:pyrroline-5-carboxylate reductase|nr:pyrroline-5-carboxylate reductase [Tannerellaceae bacterium]